MMISGGLGGEREFIEEREFFEERGERDERGQVERWRAWRSGEVERWRVSPSPTVVITSPAVVITSLLRASHNPN